MNKTTPPHYQGNIQPIDLINAQNLNFNLGNVVKYVCRAGKKQGENVLSDLEKAKNYINYEIERINYGGRRMNKQEAIKRVEQMGEYERFVDEPISKKSVLNIISQIDEPKKLKE